MGATASAAVEAAHAPIMAVWRNGFEESVEDQGENASMCVILGAPPHPSYYGCSPARSRRAGAVTPDPGHHDARTGRRQTIDSTEAGST